ncbi:hypothetical protein J1N35_041551 [Gossypium stocksii]|uniref:Uncharacterized protein n=1 Tax=Gossypium stocksii TaxID=47602 RepID=A0A9D3ZJH2_9ROSI|nr:hypothetical protein J1N35_041551 [Gossypium stocksii]
MRQRSLSIDIETFCFSSADFFKTIDVEAWLEEPLRLPLMKKISLKLKYHNNSSMATTARFYAIALFLNQVGLMPRDGSTPKVNTPHYALIAMVMSFVAAITCIIKLAYKAGKEGVFWRWEGKLPWVYHSSPSHRRFRTFPEMIGLVCALLQSILSAVAFTFYNQHVDYPLKVSFWPVVFALGLFCSKFM